MGLNAPCKHVLKIHHLKSLLNSLFFVRFWLKVNFFDEVVKTASLGYLGWLDKHIKIFMQLIILFELFKLFHFPHARRLLYYFKSWFQEGVLDNFRLYILWFFFFFFLFFKFSILQELCLIENTRFNFFCLFNFFNRLLNMKLLNMHYRHLNHLNYWNAIFRQRFELGYKASWRITM